MSVCVCVCMRAFPMEHDGSANARVCVYVPFSSECALACTIQYVFFRCGQFLVSPLSRSRRDFSVCFTHNISVMFITSRFDSKRATSRFDSRLAVWKVWALRVISNSHPEVCSRSKGSKTRSHRSDCQNAHLSVSAKMRPAA